LMIGESRGDGAPIRYRGADGRFYVDNRAGHTIDARSSAAAGISCL
jgi:hypothetical protein